MTFGQIKSIIENNLLESYRNEQEFKKSLKEFKHNVLSNKNMSKLYSLYDQLSSPQGLTENDAKDFLDEGINLIQKLLPTIKTPKTMSENVENNYSDVDSLVYSNKLDLMERLKSRKNLIQVLTSSKKETVKETINIPLKSMVSIANQTLNSYLDNLDEGDKKEFIQLMSEDTSSLKTKFEDLRSSAIEKLSTLLESEQEFEVKTKLSETIDRLKVEKFDQLNFLKLKNLEESI
jgi:predicted RND superfamily exporter protein